MQTYFGILTIGSAPVQVPANILPQTSSFAGSPKVAKLLVQGAPGNTGVFKVGGNINMTADNTTPGIFVSPNATAGQPGGTWLLETYTNTNDINLNQYFFQGTHAGDLLMYEVHLIS